MTKAYSYIRFSTPEQMKGDSLRRQLELSEEYAGKHNLELDTSLSMHDLGVSAFRGANIEHGALGAFLDAIKANKIPKGSYLLVENLDRLSRDKVLLAFELLLSIISSGIIIITLADGMRYDKNADIKELIVSLTTMSRAHNESLLKSQRISKAWENKRKNAQLKPLTKWIPAWLEMGGNGSIHLVPERVELVRAIYSWCLQGYGTRLILKKIDALNISPWGASPSIKLKSNSEIGRMPKKWHISYISRLLSNRAVIGEFTPRQSKLGSFDHPIKQYFPAIIDEETFYRVQEIRKSRTVNGQGAKGETVANLFSGLLKCGYSREAPITSYRCIGTDSSITLVNKGRKSLTRYLQCTRLKEGNLGCEACNKMWRYNDFELAFLSHVHDIDISVLFGSGEKISEQIQDLHNQKSIILGKISINEKRIEKLMNAIDALDSIPEAFINQIKNHESENEEQSKRLLEIHNQINSLQFQKADLAKNETEIGQLLESLKFLKEDELFKTRLRLSEILKQGIKSIDVFAKGAISADIVAERLKEEAQDDAAQAILLGEKESSNHFLPFFIVNYKHNERRIVYPNPSIPNELLMTVKWNHEGANEIKLPTLNIQKPE